METSKEIYEADKAETIKRAKEIMENKTNEQKIKALEMELVKLKEVNPMTHELLQLGIDERTKVIKNKLLELRGELSQTD